MRKAGQVKRIRNVMEEFSKKLENWVKEKPHDFFFEDDVRCISWLILYRLLFKDLLHSTNKRHETRLIANFNPYLFSHRDEYRDVSYDLAILNEESGINPICVIEFKFRKRYSRWHGKPLKYGASLSGFKKDFDKLKDDRAPLKYCILVQIGIPESKKCRKFVNANSDIKRVKLCYFCNERDYPTSPLVK